MNALIVIAHPNAGSFSHAMADVAARVLVECGHDVARHDLYAERFDPIQPANEIDNTRSSDPLVEAHCAAVARADLIGMFHPNWWGQPPAILKGWIDRVLRLETAYRYPQDVGFDGAPEGLLEARCAMVFNTSNTPASREHEVFGDPLDILWKHCIFGFCGVHNVVRRMYGPIAGSTAEQRASWLGDVEHLVRDVA